eukprot:2318073-Amphidinium_carterae.1
MNSPSFDVMSLGDSFCHTATGTPFSPLACPGLGCCCSNMIAPASIAQLAARGSHNPKVVSSHVLTGS